MTTKPGINPKVALDPKKYLATQRVAGQALIAAAHSLCEGLDSFSAFILTGFGAFLALALANIEKIKDFVPVQVLKQASMCFAAVAVGIGAVVKLLTSLIIANSKARSKAWSLAVEIEQRSDIKSPDVNSYFQLVDRVLYFDNLKADDRKSQLRSLLSGQPMFEERTLLSLAQYLVAAVFIEFVATFAAGLLIIGNLK
jgi:hypothetical protein